MEREELAAWLRLALTSGVGNETARKLLAAFGLPTTIFRQSLAALTQVVTAAQAAQLRIEPPALPAQVETTWNWLTAQGSDGSGAITEQRRVLVLGDAGYPASLLNMADPPLMLYLLGAGNLEEKYPPTVANREKPTINSIAESPGYCMARSVAIVGSRNPTPQGLINARQFACALSEAGLTVVSGLALGVDGAAHEGALEGLGQNGAARFATIAVVGTGLDRVYPKSHLGLARAIARNGLIVSEYPLGTPPLAANFPKRNRIIAGLTQGTLVIEAALKSGSLITAHLAAEQGKEVFAVPGSIHSTQARGCHALIRQGAKLVESAQDILEDLKLDNTPKNVAFESRSKGSEDVFDSDPESDLLQALGFDPVSLDALQARTGLNTASLQAQLMALELDGCVSRLPGGLFQRTAQA